MSYTKVEQYINTICNKIRDNRYYYSMNRENEFAVDCSSLIITSLKECGFNTNGASYTGDMLNLTKDGNFERIIIKEGTTYQRGDILVKHISGSNGHTVVYLGNNQIAEACNKKYGLRITTYYPNGYQYILRYTGAVINKSLPPMIRKGSKNIYVGLLQTFLNMFDGNRLKIDCDFGQKTYEAVKNFQLKYNLEIDGIVGNETWNKINIMMEAN